MKCLASIFLCLCLHARADFTFSWTNCPNHLIGSSTIVWQGTVAPLNYSTSFTTTNSMLVFADGWLHSGINYFACQQIATNKPGQAMPTPFSGEIQVISNPSLQVSLSIMTSTNLGGNWSNISTQTVTFPTADAQRFFMASQIKAARAMQVILPPSP